MQLGAFIMTFNRPLVLRRTLELLQAQSRRPDHVLVIDNGSSSATQDVVSAFPASWISYCGMTENVGPAGAAAFALERLTTEARGYEWIYWGDDDDPPQSPDTIQRLMSIAETSSEDTAGVAAVGALWDWQRGEARRLPDHALTGLIDVDVVGGNQQLILRSDVIRTVGLPDRRLFFGLEEIEYCLRIRRAGYRILVDGDMMRECRARSGRLDWRPPRSKRPAQPQHTLWRRYYSTRNYIFSMRMFERPDLARHEALKSLARAVLSWGRGPRFGAVFTVLQLRAIVDGYRGCMGQTVVPTPKYPAQNPQTDTGL
ncbi:MAG: glycosyltransferase [Acidobacteria bacterium]|nr:MAG: glycosyltransferase [Acidobacteriota bacterium]